MIKLNSLQYKNDGDLEISNDLSLQTLSNNDVFERLEKEFLSKYSFENLSTFSFCKDGFLGLLLQLGKKGKIAISVGETQALFEAGKTYESLGFELIWIELEKNGQVNKEQIKEASADFVFISSYVMDTFVKTNLEEIKALSSAVIISNASADFCQDSDAVYFDSYKLTGFSTSSVLLFNKELFEEKSFGFIDSIAVNTVFKALENQSFENDLQEEFKSKLEEVFSENIYFFVDYKDTLSYTLHFALKDIKAREMIRTLGLDEIHITNGEGCSLGLSKPSRIIQAMGYDELTSRNALSLTFCEKLDSKTIEKIAKTFAKKYRQIKVLNEQ
ncbi:cysteine desulfurase [Poseidonibacter lekithochrous]|uniref:cysteine desulfurase n=1 Tax=Poseidonibacter lekithochrous TaxID=1904463 RepID=UPI0008FC5FB2|nr:cysteine desulfurase [Poseidonibacter lekithochrous]QKJ22606.1 NifS/IscS family cysteine desulfurase [Poseidonibacter lekithochrous]